MDRAPAPLEAGPPVLWECLACGRSLYASAPRAPACSSGHRARRMRPAWPDHRYSMGEQRGP